MTKFVFVFHYICFVLVGENTFGTASFEPLNFLFEYV